MVGAVCLAGVFCLVAGQGVGSAGGRGEACASAGCPCLTLCLTLDRLWKGRISGVRVECGGGLGGQHDALAPALGLLEHLGKTQLLAAACHEAVTRVVGRAGDTVRRPHQVVDRSLP
jgi:hypothetical protein